jgi:hypothetical protein
VLYQLSYAPRLRWRMVPRRGPRARPWHDRPVHRQALGLLFVALSAGLGVIAVFSALEGGRAWVIALAAAALAVWMADLARRALVRRA